MLICKELGLNYFKFVHTALDSVFLIILNGFWCLMGLYYEFIIAFFTLTV